MFECVMCPAILSDWNTQDWGGKGGVCDKCSEQQADASLTRQEGLDQQQIDNYRNN